MSCAISLFSDFIQGKPHFWVKVPISWAKIDRVFYVAHRRKILHLLVQTSSQLDNHISRYKRAQTNKQTNTHNKNTNKGDKNTADGAMEVILFINFLN